MYKPFDPDTICPHCKFGFSGDDKMASFGCNEGHWYHRVCMVEVLIDPDIGYACGHCGIFQNPPLNYDRDVEKNTESAPAALEIEFPAQKATSAE
jgi:hypothetical protein